MFGSCPLKIDHIELEFVVYILFRGVLLYFYLLNINTIIFILNNIIVGVHKKRDYNLWQKKKKEGNMNYLLGRKGYLIIHVWI